LLIRLHRKQSGRAASLLFLLVWLLAFSGCGQSVPPGQPQANWPRAASRTSERAADRSSERSADRYDLGRDEQRGGHTLDRHVARSDEQLQERLRREHISAASTWTDRETAEATVAEALRAERGRIENWTQRGFPRTNLAMHYSAGHIIGRSLRRGESQTVSCGNAVIVLRAAGPDSYFVLTTYPEDRE
jgi:Bacterial CdiA-CT RNAse A domain